MAGPGTGTSSTDSLYNYLAGNQWNDENIRSLINRDKSAFDQTFNNLMGRAPTADEINNFFQQQYLGQPHPDFLDPYGTAQAYTVNAFGPDIAKHNQSQQQEQLKSSQSNVNDLVNQTMANVGKQFSDPLSSLYQSFSGNMNNMGITPGSGAFQAGAGGTIANAGMEAANQGLSAVGFPQIGNMAGTSNNPYQMSLGAPGQYTQRISGLNDFDMQSNMAKMLQQMMEPSGFEKGLGYANTASNIMGNMAGPTAMGSQMTSYICKELIKRGLLCESDLDDFHIHIMPAMFKKGRAFWKYAMDGLALVNAVNRKGLDWKVFKPLLFDRVMQESDPCKAVDLYADACHQLCILSGCTNLWDERIMRTSIFDSVLFLPRLFAYKPFREALAKCLRVKMMIIYDKPRCGVHYGA